MTDSNEKIDLLDKGFIRLVDFMGGDNRVVSSARVSFGAVSKGEEITAEQYPGDTLYYVFEGVMSLQRDGKIYEMTKNQIAVVPKGVEHAIAGKGDFKILQIILMK